MSFKIDDKEIGSIRKKENNLQTSASASFHNYKHQHTWKSGFLNLKKNTANVTTAGIIAYSYKVGVYSSSPSLAVNSRDMAKNYERLSTATALFSPTTAISAAWFLPQDFRVQCMTAGTAAAHVRGTLRSKNLLLHLWTTTRLPSFR